MVRLARLLGGIEAKYQAAKSAKQMTFFVELPLPRGLEQHFGQPAARACPGSACDRKAMLRGLFIGCGSVNAPSARYHLEMVMPTQGWATRLAALLQEQGVRAGVTERAGHQVLYIKDGDGIVRTLSLMGASRAVMEFENVRVVREVSGQVNRRLNFETANIDKTIGSAMRQVAAIEQLERSGRLQELSPALREVAQARRANPDLNLAELAVRMRLSKSAVNHRLRRLVEISEGAAAGEGPETEEEPAVPAANGAAPGPNGTAANSAALNSATANGAAPNGAPRPAAGAYAQEREPAAVGGRLA